MTLGAVHAWTLTGADGPPGGLEPGFTPGELYEGPAVGDVVLLDPSPCKSAPGGGQPQPGVIQQPLACNAMNLTSKVLNSDTLIGLISAVSATEMTLRITDNEIPAPLPHQPAGVFYRLNPGQQLSPDRPVKIREWGLTLHGDMLRIEGPNGPAEIEV